MNENVKFLLISTVLAAFLLAACETNKAPEAAVREIPQEAPAEPAPVEEAAPEAEVVVNSETGFEVSKEVYEQTLDEMRMLIETLNGIISDRNYEKWKLFLSSDYMKTYNDPMKLQQISGQSQILSENNISLRNLQDYFEWVVVPSRSAARVDDIVFIDDSRLVAYMKIKGKNTILYQLEKIGEKWQISVW